MIIVSNLAQIDYSKGFKKMILETNIPKDFLENIIRKEIYKIMTGSMSSLNPNQEMRERKTTRWLHTQC